MKLGEVLAAFALLSAVALNARAVPYDVVIDTTTLGGSSGQLAFDFIDGGLPANSIAITGFATTGSIGTQLQMGDVTGLFPGTVTLRDTQFFNELLVNLTYGDSLSFRFAPSAGAPETVSLPDSFAVFVLDPATGLSLFPTSDPTGANALFQFGIDGSANGLLTQFTPSSGSLPFSVTAVPEPATWMSLVLGLLGMALLRRRR